LPCQATADLITGFMNDLAKTSAGIEEMITLASALAYRCQNVQLSVK
jgi:hypothetical protein